MSKKEQQEEETSDNPFLQQTETQEEQSEESEESSEQEESNESSEGSDNSSETSLEDKARFFDIIDRDPEISQAITDILNARKSGTPVQKKQIENKGSGDSSNSELAELKNAIINIGKAVQELRTQTIIGEAKNKIPNFDKYREQIAAKIMQYPGMTLEDAAKLVIPQKSVRTPAGSETKRRTQPTQQLSKRLDKIAGESGFGSAVDEALKQFFE